MYVDYEFYKTEWHGKLAQEDFDKLELQARIVVDLYTLNRIKELEVISEKVKYAVCELIDYMSKLEENDGKEIASETVDKYSVTYVTSNDKDTVKAKQKDIIKKWLAHTGLMYRGIT